VIGTQLTFESVLPLMAHALGVSYEMPAARWAESRVEMPLAPERVERAARLDREATMDDLLNSLAAIAEGDGIPKMTGFILSNPRVIVTDGWDGVENAMVVHTAVAADKRIGVASGTVTRATERTPQIALIGPVDHLIQLELATAPGSSGAPVTDSAFDVRGFIVAGSTDPDRAVTYVSPASRWANLLKNAIP